MCGGQSFASILCNGRCIDLDRDTALSEFIVQFSRQMTPFLFLQQNQLPGKLAILCEYLQVCFLDHAARLHFDNQFAPAAPAEPGESHRQQQQGQR